MESLLGSVKKVLTSERVNDLPMNDMQVLQQILNNVINRMTDGFIAVNIGIAAFFFPEAKELLYKLYQDNFNTRK